jgi:light-regulated signal transduction histidine kinase (bacteriophytochrome)
MIGACLDITAAKATENKMQEIAWQQSHVVRAPLATLMGLVNLLEETSTDNRQHEILQHIKATATQLDDVIRSISQNTSKG